MSNTSLDKFSATLLLKLRDIVKKHKILFHQKFTNLKSNLRYRVIRFKMADCLSVLVSVKKEGQFK